jgi:acetyl-CoA synthetase
MLKHPDVQECAVIGAPDATRGLIVKAFVVSPRPPSDAYVKELQDFTRSKLAQHEFPRLIEFVEELPKTPAGKVNRKVLRDREAALNAS